MKNNVFRTKKHTRITVLVDKYQRYHKTCRFTHFESQRNKMNAMLGKTGNFPTKTKP